MSHRKNKPSSHSQQKIATAQFKKEFTNKIKTLLIALGCSDFLNHFPEFLYTYLFDSRMPTLKIVAAPGHQIPNDVLERMKHFMFLFMKHEKIPMYENGPEISLYDFFSLGLTLLNGVAGINETDFPYAADLKKAVEPFDKYQHSTNISMSKLYRTYAFISFMYSEMDKQLFWIQTHAATNEKGFHHYAEVYVFHPEKRHIIIEGNSRPVYRVGWPVTHGVDMVSIKYTDLGFKNQEKNINIPVFIQTHALNRLMERLDCMDPPNLQFFTYVSLLEPIIIPQGSHDFLLELRFDNIKAGYFKMTLLDGILLIRTFLFLTNCGTPEGTKLQQKTGLKKLDSSYLAMDKLSTILSIQIEEDKELYTIFSEAGCAGLFDLRPLADISINRIHKENCGPRIIKYLKPEKTDISSILDQLDQNQAL